MLDATLPLLQTVLSRNKLKKSGTQKLREHKLPRYAVGELVNVRISRGQNTVTPTCSSSVGGLKNGEIFIVNCCTL